MSRIFGSEFLQDIVKKNCQVVLRRFFKIFEKYTTFLRECCKLLKKLLNFVERFFTHSTNIFLEIPRFFLIVLKFHNLYFYCLVHFQRRLPNIFSNLEKIFPLHFNGRCCAVAKHIVDLSRF